jgi:hypothetical protein
MTAAVLALAGSGLAATTLPATAAAHPRHAHECTLRNVRYRDAGTLTSWGLTENSNDTWSGTLSVAVVRADRHASSAIGTTVTYTITDAHVHFGPHATTPPAAGSRVQVIGRALAIGKRCSGTGGPITESFAISRIRVHAPAPAGSTTS